MRTPRALHTAVTGSLACAVLGGTMVAMPASAAPAGLTRSSAATPLVVAAADAALPEADILDVDFRDGTPTDHAQNLAPTVVGDPVFGADASRAHATVAFDGVQDAIKYPFISQFAKLQSGFALECSFRYDAPANPTSEKALCSAKEGGGFATVANAAGITFMAHIGGGYKTASAPLTPGEWYHTVAVWDGAAVKLYVNGELVRTTVATGTFKAPSASASSLVIGGDTQPSNGVDFLSQSTLQNVRVYTTPLTAAEVGALATDASTPPAAPAADVFDVDFSDGTPAESVSGLPAQTWGTPAIVDYAPLAKKVGVFDGSSAYYYDFSNAQYDRIRTSMSVECTFKYDADFAASGETNGNLCGGKESGGFSVTLYGNKLSFNPHIGGSYRNTGVELPASDRWVHAVGTYDGRRVRLYVDGVLAAETAATGNLSNPSPAAAEMFVIGGDASNGKPQFFAPSTISSARIFTRALDLDEVLALQHQAFGSRDASDLVTVASSTPAAGSRLTRATRYRVDLANDEAQGRDVVHTLDGQPIKVGDVIGAGLKAGPHVIRIQGHDVFGNVISEAIEFTSADVPTGGGTETDQDGGQVTLAAVATNPNGGDVRTTFTKADVTLAEDGVQGTLEEIPTTLDFTGTDETPVAGPLRPGDDVLVPSPSAAGISYQRFDVAASSDEGQELSWNGTIDPTRQVALRVWNGSRWMVVAESRGSATGSVSLTGQLDPAHVVDGTVPVLVTAEDPFADDLAKRVADGFEDPDAYDFSIAHLTDTQYLAEGAVEQETPEERAKWTEAYTSITQWIADNSAKRKIMFAAHTGDLIENLHSQTDFSAAYVANAKKEFEVASAAQKILDDAGVVNSVLPGNHDNRYGTDIGQAALYNDYFGPERYEALEQSQATWGTENASYHPWKEGDNSNSFNLFTASGLDFVVVNLGFGVDAEEIAWANSVLQQYQDRNAIVQTHAHTTPSTNPDGRGGALSYDGNKVRNEVAATNPNVFLVLSGHEHGVNIEVVRNLGKKGNNVVELLADYQFYTMGADELGLTEIGGYTPTTQLRFGSSFFRLLQFDVDRAEMSVDTYSALLDDFGATEYDTNQRYNGQEDDFALPVQLETRTTSLASDSLLVVDPTEEVIGVDTARSGWPAEVVWDGLEAGETYGWYATSVDAASGAELPGEVGQLSVFTAQAGGTEVPGPTPGGPGVPAPQPGGTDTTAPVITVPPTTTVEYGATFDALRGVTAMDDTDGDIAARIAVTGEVDPFRIGTYTLAYSVADASGNQSVATRTVEVTAPPAPISSTRPSISGRAKAGSTLTANIGTWQHTDHAEVTVRWFRDGAPIDGAVGVEYRVTKADAGAVITAQVRAKSPGNDAVTATSTGTSVAKLSPKVSATLAKRRIKAGERAVLRVTVAAGVRPVGIVAVQVDGRLVKNARLSRAKDGTLTIRLPRLDRGTHRVRTTFLGSTQLTRKASSPIKVRVVR